ncbi:MAG: glycosyltransferase family 4 protein [Deltaproteobacteria bacterium]|nr:glycosyltransferase family 4 protein [Deltaproteobacteria bacterium]
MIVLLIHNFYQHPGGEDEVFRAEAALLRSQGHEVVEFVEDNRKVDGVSPLKAAVDAIWSREAQRRLRTLIREKKPDVAHFHNTFLRISPAAYYTCKEEGVPVAQTLHNYRLVCPGALLMRDGRVCEDCLGRAVPWPGVAHGCWRGSRTQTAVVAGMLAFHRVLKTWHEQVDCYIALTEFARRKFIEGGLPAEKIVVKPNFVGEELRVTSNELQFSRHPSLVTRYFLFVGRLSPEKGLGTLLRAWQKLKDVPLKIIGDGPLLEAVRAFNGGGVQVLGRRPHDEVIALMKGARCVVFPSEWYEGFPMTIAEAFACGVPVIASRLGAMAEIVEDGRTGLLFEPGNADDLAAKVEWAWAHSEQMAEMGREARREYEEKYTAERNYEMLMQIYRRVMSNE